MPFSKKQLDYLGKLAISAATAAGEYISRFDRAQLQVSDKVGGDSLASQVVTQVDIACEQLIKECLQASCKRWDIALLSEETADEYPAGTHPRLEKDYFWCIDPLDGTLPFINDRPGYAVSIALVSRLGESQLGVVYQPADQTLYYGTPGKRSTSTLFRNHQPWRPLQVDYVTSKDGLTPGSAQTLTFFFDRSAVAQPGFDQLEQILKQLATKLGYAGYAARYDAGAVVNALGVLEHAPACYFKMPKSAPGGGSLWDFSATAAMVKAAGGWVSDIFGNPLDLNRPDSNFMNHRGVIYASTADIARGVMSVFDNS